MRGSSTPGEQSRIATSTGPFLDLIAWDYFGARFLRRRRELDNPWRRRIVQELLRPRATRAAIVQMLTDLTGRAPIMIEPWSPGDCGGMGHGCRVGYSAGGRYGSLLYHHQIFITAYRPPGTGSPGVSGWSTPYGGYGKAGSKLAGSRLAYVDKSQLTGIVTDEEIYRRIAETVAAGVTAWVALRNAPDNSTNQPRLAHNAPRNSQYLAIGL